MRVLLMAQLVCTLMMTGIIWFVQVVHYPLFLRVGPDRFAAYEAEHATRTGWVVGPLMCVELATAGLMLAARFRPPSISAAQAAVGAGMAVVIWVSTAWIQVPLHTRLSSGYDVTAIAMLIATNWIRTIAWTVRTGLLLHWAARLMRMPYGPL